MIHSAVPLVIAACLIGAGVYGLLARRHPMMLLLGAQLVLAGAALLLVAGAGTGVDPTGAGATLAALLAILGAAVTLLVAGVALLMFAVRGRTDLTDAGPDGTPLARPVDDATAPEPVVDDEAQPTGEVPA